MAPTPPVNSINPIQATPDPEYKSYQWSRAISPIEGNKSSEIAIKGAANMLTEGVNAADTLIKNSLTNDIEDKAGAKRDAYSDELGNTLATLRGEKTSGAMAYADASTDSAAKMNLLSTDKKDNVPPTLQGLKGIVEKQEALKANGKQTESQYLANINSLAKQYRAAWPGYREFIDGTFDQVTQRGPANKLIQSRVAELDAYAQAAKAKASETDNLIKHALEVDHLSAAPQWAADFKAGKIDGPGIQRKYAQAMQWEYNAKKAEADWKVETIGTERKAKLAGDAINARIANTVDNFIDTMGSTVGYNQDKIMSDIATGNPELKGHGEELATKIAAFKAQAIAHATQEAMKTQDGQSIYRDLGPAKFNELISNNPKIKGLDTTISLLNSKEHGLATVAIRAQSEALDNAGLDAISSPTSLGKSLFGLTLAAHAKWGDAANTKLMQDFIGVGGMQDLPAYINRLGLLGATQPSEHDTTLPPEDRYVALNDAIKQAQADKSKKPDPIAFTRLFNNTVDGITNPKLPAKMRENYINFAFSPKNLGILESVADDHPDPQTGKKIPGKVWLYQQFTSEGVAKSVAEMARTKPELYTKYNDFVTQEGQHIVSQEVPKLNSLFDNPRLKMSYDNKTHQFSVQEDKTYKDDLHAPNAKGQSIFSRMIGAGAERVQAGTAQQHVDKVNQVLRSVGIMSQYSPDKPDANAYALRVLQAMSPPGSVGDKMMKAIMATAPKEKEPTK